MTIMGDWNSAQYIASQVFISISYILVAWTYFVASRPKQLAINISACITVGTGFALLGAWVGVGMALVAIARDITSDIIWARRTPAERMKNTRLDWVLLALWLSLLTIATAFTHEGFMTLFAYFATATFTISIWQKNPLVYRFLGWLVGIFWIIYNIVVHSFMGLTLESVLLVFVIGGTIMYIRKMKKDKLAVPN